MKKFLFTTLLMAMAMSGSLSAQPFLQLIPRGMYEEDVKYSGSDWAGFYRTSQYDEIGCALMVLIPTGDSISGIAFSESLRYIRILKGQMKGNGITYIYYTIDLKGKLKLNNPEGEGFMVMKDDGEKASVFAKHGNASGISEQKGCFSIGKKKAIELRTGYNTQEYDWSGQWVMPYVKYKNAFLQLDKDGDMYVGYYTLKDFKTSETTYTNYAMNLVRSKQTITTFPKSQVTVLGISYGDCLYFIEYHKDGERLGAGMLTMSPDKQSMSGPHIENSKVKNLNDDDVEIIKCKR